MSERVRSDAPSVNETSLGELFARLQEQTTSLIHDELRLAQAEMSERGKRVGLGAGMFGGAGLLALFGAAALVAAAILALAVPLDAWAAALIVGAMLLVVGGAAALIGRREVSRAMPLVPTQAIDSVGADVHALKPGNVS